MTPLEICDAMFARIAAGDWAGLSDLAHEDYVMHEPPELPFGGDWRGRDALARLYTHVWSYWDDVVVERLGVIGDENYFCLLLRMTMTSKLSGNRITQSMAEATRCVGGLMAETTIHYFSPAEVAREAGPARAGAVHLQEA
jgi:hypothetical protein